ncbi:short-chain fatty acid transporter [Peribacillus asahii]|uniref:short-chain fatty acid transporter n=1 Tax=Peribacillus asahii TaxID=228899 RepID=UPI00207929E1|nr:TIGR00366 family protein [Peribacillus asahii]USK59258.1 TIGR00366 family protein [Peribacillus asahii]
MINKLLMFFVKFMRNYLPNPFTLAWLITVFVAIVALVSTPSKPSDLVNYWGDGLFGLLPFAMQMSLILITGYALAASNVVKKVLIKLVKIPRTPKQTILFVAIVSMVLYFLNWGLGLVAGGLLAREAAKQHKDVDFRLLVTAAFSGIIITHGGLSASIPLLINTEGHFAQDQMGLVPLTQTIFGAQSLFITISLIIVIPLLCVLMMPKKGQEVLVDGSLFDEEIAASSEFGLKKLTISEKIDNSKILGLTLGVVGLIYLIYYFFNNGFNLNINTIIIIFIVLGVLAHGSLMEYSKAVTAGTSTAAGIILQFPFYAGIMGIMHESGLVMNISDWLLSLATYETFELFSYFSSLIISVFVPSAGGHWAVQAPFMLPAAETLGVEPWKVAMGVAWGESIWNIVCPFWALPLIAIAKIDLRDLIGFSVLLFIVGNIIAITGILLFQ